MEGFSATRRLVKQWKLMSYHYLKQKFYRDQIHQFHVFVGDADASSLSWKVFNRRETHIQLRVFEGTCTPRSLALELPWPPAPLVKAFCFF